MFGTYAQEDVTVLLKDITGLVEPLGTAEREQRIQSGVHYSEMLPLEYEPSETYLQIYRSILARNAQITADAVGRVAAQIWKEKGSQTVLVSLARAGTPIGILIKRYLQFRYHVDIPHYTISIIREKGIDQNALKFLLSKHAPETLQFVDGWTGKGAIKKVLVDALATTPQVKPNLAVLSDPAYAADKCGTHEDFLIASSCLNATVSGLLSRTFLRPDIIGEDDFHGACFFREWMDRDVTYEFINTIASAFRSNWKEDAEVDSNILSFRGWPEVQKIAREFEMNNINLVKPSIGETTRVLLRRLPWKILVSEQADPMDLKRLPPKASVPLVSTLISIIASVAAVRKTRISQNSITRGHVTS